MRYNDIRDGTNVAAEVIEKYNTAWEGKGMTQENGLFINWYAPKQDEKKTASDIGFTAWYVCPRVTKVGRAASQANLHRL